MSIKFVEREERKKKGGGEPNTKHAARATQVERQVEKKAYTHDTDSWKQANRQGRCVRETESIIGKASRLGIQLGSADWPDQFGCFGEGWEAD